MNTKCIKCNIHLDFRNRRGNKLSNYTCKCGGKFERLTCIGSIPEFNKEVETTAWNGEPYKYTQYTYAYQDKKGKEWIHEKDGYIPNPFPLLTEKESN